MSPNLIALLLYSLIAIALCGYPDTFYFGIVLLVGAIASVNHAIWEAAEEARMVAFWNACKTEEDVTKED